VLLVWNRQYNRAVAGEEESSRESNQEVTA